MVKNTGANKLREYTQSLLLKSQSANLQSIKVSDIAKENVIKVFPKAKCERDGAFFFVFVIVNKKQVDLGAGFSSEGAWCSANVTVSSYSKKS